MNLIRMDFLEVRFSILTGFDAITSNVGEVICKNRGDYCFHAGTANVFTKSIGLVISINWLYIPLTLTKYMNSKQTEIMKIRKL
jgi:hypothetical protein